MGGISAKLADLTILTSDNPRSEDPNKIIEDMMMGVPEDCARNLLSIVDRKQAIKTACRLATEKDVIVTIDGEQHVVNVKINEEAYAGKNSDLEKDLVEAFNKGVKKSQLVAADKMKAIMGDMPPGLMG